MRPGVTVSADTPEILEGSSRDGSEKGPEILAAILARSQVFRKLPNTCPMKPVLTQHLAIC